MEQEGEREIERERERGEQKMRKIDGIKAWKMRKEERKHSNEKEKQKK